MSSRAKSLTKLAIVFMSFVTIFGFRNIINNTQSFGLFAAILFLIGGAIYAIPMVLVTSEFGSIKKLENQESGMGSFCTFSLGQKQGFLASWASYFGNLFFFATIAPFTVMGFSFLFYGANGFDAIANSLYKNNGLSPDNAGRVATCVLALFSIMIFWAGTFVSKMGPKWLGKATTIGGMASLGLGVLFILIALCYTIPVKGTISWELIKAGFNPATDSSGNKQADWDWWSFLSSFPWLIFAYNGIETMSAFIKDTKGGAKGFKTASLIGMSIVICLMVVGVILVSLTIEKDTIDGWGIPNSYYYSYTRILGLENDSVAGKAVIRIVGLITGVSGLGSMFFWTAGPAKVFFSEVPEKALGKWLAKTDKNGMPTNALLVQGAIVTFILILVGVTTKGSLVDPTDPTSDVTTTGSFIERLFNSATTLAIIQMFFYFWAYVWFRLKKDDEEREYIFFKGKLKWIPITMCIITLVLLAISFFFGAIPSPQTWEAGWVDALIDFLIIFGGAVFFMGAGLFIWWFNMERPERSKGNNKKVEQKTKEAKTEKVNA
ncbi:amino acid permease family protein [Spiroplasma chinense]|uniref:Amino acid permease family protein n=1 Tax=Spiroplasma chinense TaxID=216932 RepID=A0A5B9Y479_9MOLU|nr:amino acid permease [Spiroplasma chinense]QEH61841.1 amino acid permease family protein [Spiroplasma chinense]